MKTPKQIRNDIRDLAQHLGQVQRVLLGRCEVAIAQIGKECKRLFNAVCKSDSMKSFVDDNIHVTYV